MHVFRELFKDQLTENPKKQVEKQQNGYNSHLGWVFVCNKFVEKPRSVRTYQSLFAASDSYTYFTPNTFYRNDQRHSGALRWLNAMVIDIDVKHLPENYILAPNGAVTALNSITLNDVLEAIESAGLFTPSMIVSTPSGGFHVYWYFDKPKRALPRVIEHYKRVQTAIAEAIGGDPAAIGAERWFRVPTQENTIFQSDSRVAFDDICEWLTIQYQEHEEEQKSICVNAEGLLYHPAVQKILEGVSEGQRDNACYTLALTYKVSGYDESEAEKRLYEWNKRNDPPMRQIDLKRKVKSAYKSGSKAGPSAYWIRLLSGVNFTYQKWDEAKPREERTYSHFDEWKKDVIKYFKKQDNAISGSQREIASAIKSSSDKTKSIPYTTFKKIMQHLIEIGIITKSIEGKGRGAVTTFTLSTEKKEEKVVPFQRKEKQKNNGFNSNTFIDQVVGGTALEFSFPGSAASLGRDRRLDFSARSSPLRL